MGIKRFNFFKFFVVSAFFTTIFSCNDVFNASEPKVSSLMIETLPKTVYSEGDKADWSKLSVSILYTDGKIELIDEYEIDIKEGTELYVQNEKATVSAFGKTVSFPLKVYKDSSEILKEPEYKDYDIPADQEKNFFPDFSDMAGTEIKAWFKVNTNEAFENVSVKTALKKQNVSTEAEFFAFLTTASDDFIKKWANGISSGGISENYTESSGVSSDIPKPSQRVNSNDTHFVLSYSDTDGTAEVWYFNGALDSVTDVIIPSELNGYTVVGIKDSVFQNNTSLMSVTIPNTVKNIGDQAFYGCVNLEKVELPTEMTKIGNYAFSGCVNLSEINIPETLDYLGSYAFKDTKIKSAVISKDVKSAGSNIFEGCTELKTIEWNYQPAKEKYSVIDDVATVYDYIGPSCSDNASVGSVVAECELIIGDNVEIIPEYFMLGSNVTKITAGSNLKYICSGAFSRCEKLKSINLQDILQIGSGVFSNCILLESIGENIPEKLAYLGKEAFYKCKTLYIENPLFYAGCTKIYNDTFSGCSSLKGKLTISTPQNGRNYNSIYIGKNAFSLCTGLSEVQFGSPQNDANYLAYVDNWGSIEKFRINENSFFRCSKIEKITFYNRFRMEASAFLGCSSLVTVDFLTEPYFKNFINDDVIFSFTLNEFTITTFSGCAIDKIIVHTKYEYDLYTQQTEFAMFKNKYILSE